MQVHGDLVDPTEPSDGQSVSTSIANFFFFHFSDTNIIKMWALPFRIFCLDFLHLVNIVVVLTAVDLLLVIRPKKNIDWLQIFFLLLLSFLMSTYSDERLCRWQILQKLPERLLA